MCGVAHFLGLDTILLLSMDTKLSVAFLQCKIINNKRQESLDRAISSATGNVFFLFNFLSLSKVCLSDKLRNVVAKSGPTHQAVCRRQTKTKVFSCHLCASLASFRACRGESSKNFHL
jgi:predicted nucleotide-binding protein